MHVGMSAAPTPEHQANSGKAELEGLLNLITSATRDAMAIYENSGHGIPSIHSTTAHPLDTEAATFAMRNTIRTLEGACEQLCTTLASPSHTLLNRTMTHFEPTAMRVAVEARIPDLLVDNPQGLPVTEISGKTGIDGRKLRKVLRALATKHCFCEVGPDVFANNRLSLTLVDSPATDLLLLMMGMIHEGSFSLPDSLADPQFGPSDEASKSAFMYFHKDKGIDGNLFSYLETNPDLSKRFSSGMIGWAKLTDNLSLIQDFPWGDLPSGTTLCDIGGGIGTVSMPLSKAHPHLQLTLQDQSSVLNQARAVWRKEHPQAVDEGRINFVPIDFFKESPVQGHDFYYVRHVIHNWPDADAVVILKNIRQAMGSHSRLLIHEYILHNFYEAKSRGPRDAALAPEPLLPNYGAGNIRLYYQDLNMLSVLNAGERTLDEFKILGAQAGLEFVRVWEFAENGMVEYKMA